MASGRDEIAGCILAGGRGRRLGGIDKGLVELSGRTLVDRVLDALRPQVAEVLISANRNAERYAALGYPVVPDRGTAYDGPLAGFAAALAATARPLVACVPCDSPFLPHDLVARLQVGLEAENAELAVARSGGRLQPVFVLMRRELASPLAEALERGERKPDRWFQEHRTAVVDFDALEGFANVNTPEDLQQAEARLERV